MSRCDAATEFHVATDGDDSNPGTRTAPFATLARARDAVRETVARRRAVAAADVASGQAAHEPETPHGRARVPGQALTVWVRGGTYRLGETLTLTGDDSGTAQAPVAWRACPGERPVLSGARRVTGWRPYTGRILQADLREDTLRRWDRRQLFLDGKRQIRARYPNADPADPWRGGSATVAGAAEEHSVTAFTYPEGSLPRRWAKPTQGEVMMVTDWGYTTLSPIRAVDERRRAITLAQGVRNFGQRHPWFGFQPSWFGISVPYRFHVENLLEELDTPREWCVDAAERKAYFWPPTELSEHSEVSVPVLDCLVDLCGARWVAFDGFAFTETRNAGSNMHRPGYYGSGAMYPEPGYTYCGEALRLQDAEHCRITNCRFLEVGGNAIYVDGYNLRHVIQGNEIAHAGHCGIGVIGARDQGTQVRMPIGVEIADNHIHHCGEFDKVAPGVFCGVSTATAIRHNLIEHLPHHGINLGASGYGGNLVEYNRLRFCCMRNYDIGVINCWMEDDADPGGDEGLQVARDAVRSGHVFRHNHISDTTGSRKAAGAHDCTFGLYLDSHSSNCLVFANIIECNHYRGIRINGGRNNLIENNILIDPGNQDGCLSLSNPGDWPIWPQMGGFMVGNRFCRNVCLLSGMARMNVLLIQDSGRDIPRALAESDYNLFFSRHGDEYFVQFAGSGGSTLLSLAQWQALGNDVHSLTADPRFADPDHGDFRLRPDSPALGLGFVPIDASRIGIRGQRT